MVKKQLLVYGCGRTGSEIAKNLSEHDVYTYRGISVTGTKKILSLEDVPSVDAIILALTAKAPDFTKPTGWLMRDSELEHNYLAVKEYVSYIKQHQQTQTIVVTNPADALAHYLQNSGLNAIAFGHGLDLKRYQEIEARVTGVVGPHGAAIPILGSNSITDYTSLMYESDMRLATYVRANGIPYSDIGVVFKQEFENGFTRYMGSLNAIEKELLEISNKKLRAQYVRLQKLDAKSAHPDSNRG